MKSIKEKAKEYDRVVKRISANESLVDVSGREQFEAGATYVLGVLYDAAYKEDWITNPKDGIRRFFEIYRQLKK